MQSIFETERLSVRKLQLTDFEPFNKMQCNRKVMQYVRARPMTYDENKEELRKLIKMYTVPNNDFWIYAIERKEDNAFVGTLALVKDENNDDEIGYRFLEKHWNNGYGREIVEGLIDYCKNEGFTKLIACVAIKNVASTKIIQNSGFQFVKDFVSDDLKVPEQKFELILNRIQDSMIAKTPNTPYYAVIFTSLQSENTSGYIEMAEKMVTLAQQQEGFLGVESARSQIGITVSYWESLEAIKKWKMNIDHTEARNKGRERWYQQFKTRICRVERDYEFTTD